MSRSWGELLGEDGAAPEPDEQGGRFFSRLRDSLSKSRRALTGEIASAWRSIRATTLDWERLEEALIAGDVGVPATAELVQRLEARGGICGPSRRGRGAVRRAADARPRAHAGRDPRRRRQRHGQDDDDRQARGEAHGARPLRPRRRRATRTAPPRRSSSRSGPSARERTSSARSAAATPRPSPTTRSTRRRRAAATS